MRQMGIFLGFCLLLTFCCGCSGNSAEATALHEAEMKPPNPAAQVTPDKIVQKPGESKMMAGKRMLGHGM